MWGGRDLAVERARREELTRRVDAQQTTISFLCARINQLETERVLLLRQLTNIDLPTPTLHITPTAMPANAGGPMTGTEALEAIAALGIFEDDPRHAPAGWHNDGTVNYGRVPDPRVGAVVK